MKTFKLLTFVTCLVLVCSVVSCSDDDLEFYKKYEREDLFGYYRRSDSMDNFGYELYLHNEEWNYEGGIVHYFGGCGFDPIEEFEVCLWGATWDREDSFTWNVNHDVLRLEYDDEVVLVRFSISENGNLHLYDPSRLTDNEDLYFIRMDLNP